MTNHKSHSPDQWERIAEGLFNGIYHLIKIFYAGIGEFFRFIQTKYFEFIFVTVPTCTLLTFTQWDQCFVELRILNLTSHSFHILIFNVDREQKAVVPATRAD